jgi:hypothetical protein
MPVAFHLEMTMRLVLSALAGLLLSTLAVLADPVGRYNVTGTNPGGGGRYTGTVSVERTGQTYRVIWIVGGTRYIGTGIGNKDFLAVSYRSGDQSGLALYGASGDDWEGVWTYSGGREIGAEAWERR